MIKLNNVTLVAAISSEDYLEKTKKSLEYSSSLVEFADVQLIIEKMEYKYYSWWLLKHLKDYIKTEFCLVVQWDSGIVDPSLWTNEFLEYDYIGACWANNFPNRVGNGGGSLRSLKFLEESSIIANDIPHGQFLLGNEDLYACVTKYEYMLSKGIKFAPLDLARRFSVERPIMEASHKYNDLTTYQSFLFHGDFNVAGMNLIN